MRPGLVWFDTHLPVVAVSSPRGLDADTTEPVRVFRRRCDPQRWTFHVRFGHEILLVRGYMYAQVGVRRESRTPLLTCTCTLDAGPLLTLAWFEPAGAGTSALPGVNPYLRIQLVHSRGGSSWR